MKKKRTVLTTAEQIVAYWEEAGPSELDMGCDWADALDHCWRCGVKRSLQRCHIIPHQDPHNGPDVPENLVLVCSWCHKEAPCCDDPNAMWEWIKRTRSDVAGSIWAARVIEEMERQTGKTRDVLFQGIDYLPTEFWNLYQDIRAKRTGLHPGDFVTTAAWACIETLRGLAARRQSITSA
ncbi:MAG TPA: HNH endonuclease signature motif containing protein, partial [Acidobacteriaceae bacterium]